MSSQVPNPNPSRRACRRCRTQKRQCDKALPVCSLCSRLGHICAYDDPVAAPSLIHPLLDPLANTDISITMANKAFAFVGSEFGLRDHIARYFNIIHTWLLVISQERYYRRYSSVSNGQNPSFSILTLSIILISAVPQTLETGIGLQPNLINLYLSIKSFIGVLEGMGMNSLDLLQARLLVTIFEIGHGFLQAGNISIGAATRAATSNGPGVTQYMEALEYTEEMANEEWAQIWCGILVLDRYIALENGRGRTATKGHTLTNQLPSNNDKWGRPEDCRQFSKLTEASHLVERILNAMYEPTVQKSFSIEEATTVMFATDSFGAIISNEPIDRQKLHVSSLVLSKSALLAFHDSGMHVNPSDDDYAHCRRGALTASTRVISEVLSIAKEAEQGTSEFHLQRLPPFASFMIYKAAVMVLERQRAGDTSLPCEEALDCFRNTLRLIGQRWLGAKQYLQALEDI